MSLRELSLLECRVLGVLVEKALTVPDTYPLSLNALTLGCNQKTARDPVLNASESDVQSAALALLELGLVTEVSGSRVRRFQHNMARGLGVPSQAVALLATLMLRGPQTTAELRANSERFHRFADISSVEGFLEELVERGEEKGGALLTQLPRAAGSRESRWMHCLSGVPTVDAYTATPLASAASGGLGNQTQTMAAELASLKEEMAELKRWVEKLFEELGVQKPCRLRGALTPSL